MKKSMKWFTCILCACAIIMGTLYPHMSVSAEESDAEKAYQAGFQARYEKTRAFIPAVGLAIENKRDENGNVVDKCLLTQYNEAVAAGADNAQSLREQLVAQCNLALSLYPAYMEALAEDDAAYNALPDSAKVKNNNCYENHWRLVSNYQFDREGRDDNSHDDKARWFYSQLLSIVGVEDDDEEEPEVVTSSGEVISTTIPTENTTDITVVFTTPAEELNSSAVIEDGNYVTLSVEAYVGDTAKQVLNNAAQSAGGTVSKFLDISLNKWTPNGAPNGKVTELNVAVEIVVETPEGVDTYAYDFAVLRIHNGVVTILPDLDDDPATITFATDRFSAYAVIYGEKGSFDKYKTSRLSTKDNVPKTGDSFPVAIPAAVVLGVLAGALTLRYGKKI